MKEEIKELKSRLQNFENSPNKVSIDGRYQVEVDKLTKLVHYVATTTTVSAPQLATIFLREVVRLHGVPQSILSDRDPRFTAHFWRSFWEQLGTTLTMSTAYHPQTDGQTERANRTLETMLRSLVSFDQTDWDEHLAVAELAINSAKQASTQQSPFLLTYGQEASMPIDQAIVPLRHPSSSSNPAADERIRQIKQQWEQAKKSIEQAQQRQAQYADQHRRSASFVVGDQVLVSTADLKLIGSSVRTAKFASRFIGPFPIKRVVNDNAYELELPEQLRIHPTLNISRLKAYRDGKEAFPDRPAPHARPPPTAVEDNGAPSFEVDRILSKRGTGKRTRYLVSWVGYPQWEATWEPRENLEGSAEEALQEFEALQEQAFL